VFRFLALKFIYYGGSIIPAVANPGNKPLDLYQRGRKKHNSVTDCGRCCKYSTLFYKYGELAPFLNLK
jgi:hypothetical protein